MGSTTGRTRLSAPSDRLIGAVVVLVGIDAVGGLTAIATGINEAREAWGSIARLAAPWPMILAQVLLTSLAVGPRRKVAIVASALLALACLVSAISGFFDGGMEDDRLSTGHRAFQWLLILWTALVGVLASDNGLRAARSRAFAAKR